MSTRFPFLFDASRRSAARSGHGRKWPRCYAARGRCARARRRGSDRFVSLRCISRSGDGSRRSTGLRSQPIRDRWDRSDRTTSSSSSGRRAPCSNGRLRASAASSGTSVTEPCTSCGSARPSSSRGPPNGSPRRRTNLASEIRSRGPKGPLTDRLHRPHPRPSQVRARARWCGLDQVPPLGSTERGSVGSVPVTPLFPPGGTRGSPDRQPRTSLAPRPSRDGSHRCRP